MSQEKQLIESVLKIVADRVYIEADAIALAGVINLVLGASYAGTELKLFSYLKPFAEELLKELKHVEGQRKNYHEQ